MHHIHHTEAIILGSRDFGESGRYYHLFTRDLGLVMASASGVRKMSSKLRFILQDFSYIKVDLVQGKNILRITSASKTEILQEITKDSGTFAIFANVARLLRRLLAGVEPNATLFDDLRNGLLVLEKSKGGEGFRNIEAIIVLRMLDNLGYIGEHDILKTLTKSPFEDNLVFEVEKNRSKIFDHINKALKETHL